MTNSLIQRYRTLGELLAELKARLGFVAQGPSSNNSNPVMLSFLQEAHDYVYTKLDPTPMRKKTVITLEQGSFLYDWHNDEEDEDIDPGMALSVWIVDGISRTLLVQGITERHREDNSRSQPMRYDTLNGQIELWPVPDRSGYGLLIEYTAGKPRFTEMSDRAGVNDRLVLMYAIYMAQVHYRHPGYQATSVSFSALMTQERIRQHENRRYFVRGGKGRSGEVIGSDGDYRFVMR